MITDGVKLVDLAFPNSTYEQDNGCDVMAVYYWYNEILYLQPFEICLSIANGLVTATCSFNLLSISPVQVNSGSSFRSGSLAIDTNYNKDIVMAGWIEKFKSGITNFMIRSFQFDFKPTNQPTSDPTPTPTAETRPPSETPTTAPPTRPLFSVNISDISGVILHDQIREVNSRATPNQCYQNTIDISCSSTEPYFYLATSIGTNLYSTTINLYGEKNDSNINDWNDPNLWPDALNNVDVASTINDDLVMHVNSMTNNLDYFFSSLTIFNTQRIRGYQILADSVVNTKVVAAGKNPQAVEYGTGYIIVYYKIASTNYGIEYQDKSFNPNGTANLLDTGEIATSLATNIGFPKITIIENEFVVILYVTATTTVLCDVYSNAFGQHLQGTKVGSFDSDSAVRAHDIKPLFRKIDLRSSDNDLFKKISDQAFIITYSRTWEGTLQILFDVLYLDYNATYIHSVNNVESLIIDTNLPFIANIGDDTVTMIQNGVKIVDISIDDNYEMFWGCDVFAVYYWYDENIYLRPFEICADISDSIATASIQFNWLSDQPYFVNSAVQNDYESAYGLSIETDINGKYVTVGWLQIDSRSESSLFTSSLGLIFIKLQPLHHQHNTHRKHHQQHHRAQNHHHHNHLPLQILISPQLHQHFG